MKQQQQRAGCRVGRYDERAREGVGRQLGDALAMKREAREKGKKDEKGKGRGW
jgi:hypothetical protein